MTPTLPHDWAALRMPRAMTSMRGSAAFGSIRHITAVIGVSPILANCSKVPSSPASVREPLLT